MGVYVCMYGFRYPSRTGFSNIRIYKHTYIVYIDNSNHVLRIEDKSLLQLTTANT